MTAVADIGALITASPEIRGGRPRIAGTGATVQRIVRWHQMGLTPEQIAEEIPHLSLAQVYAALAYYHANRTEVDYQLQQDDVEGERVASQASRHANS